MSFLSLPSLSASPYLSLSFILWLLRRKNYHRLHVTNALASPPCWQTQLPSLRALLKSLPHKSQVLGGVKAARKKSIKIALKTMPVARDLRQTYGPEEVLDGGEERESE